MRFYQTFVGKVDPETGEVYKEKGRIVILGNQMVGGHHYNDSSLYSPCADMLGVKMGIIQGHQPGNHLATLDVTGAFLQATAERQLIASPPENCEAYNDHGRQMIVELLANWYGDPKAAMRWFLLGKETTLKLGARQNYLDPSCYRIAMTIKQADRVVDPMDPLTLKDFNCNRLQAKDAVLSKAVESAEPEVYSFVNKNALIASLPTNGPNVAWVNIITHVDDTLTASNHRGLQLLFCYEYLKAHKGTLEKSPTSFVGVTWKTTASGGLQIGTPASDKKLRELSKLNNCHKVHFPIHDYVTTQAKEKGCDDAEQAKIDAKVLKVLKDSNVRELIGTMSWMANFKSSIMFAVRQLQRCVANPQEEHLDQLRHTVKYTLTHPGGDTFRGMDAQPYPIIISTDANLGIDSNTGITVHFCGGTIHAISARQTMKKTDTYNAENVSFMTATQWARFFHLYAREFGILTGPVPIAGDNEKIMSLYEDPHNPARNIKCHRLRFNWAREQVQRMEAIPVFVRGTINVSDLLTKPVIGNTWRFLQPQLSGEKAVEFFDRITEVMLQYGFQPNKYII